MLCRKIAMTTCMVQAALLSGHLQAVLKAKGAHQEAQLANGAAAQLTNTLTMLMSVLRRGSASLAKQSQKLDTLPSRITG